MKNYLALVLLAIFLASFQANARRIPQATSQAQTEDRKSLSIIFEPVIPGCPDVKYEILYPLDPLVKKADAFAASLGLPLVHIMIGRHIDEKCYNAVYADRPLDPKELWGWEALVDAVRNPCYSFVFQDQIQVVIDEKFEKFLNERTLEYAIYHEVAHHVPEIEKRAYPSFMMGELAVDQFVVAHHPEFTKEEVFSNLDKFIEFKESKQWSREKLLPEVQKTLPDVAFALDLQKKYYLEYWK